VPAWSLANSVNTVIGNITGQGKADEISKITKRFLVISLGVTLLMIAVLLPFPAFWIELISGKSEYTKDCLQPLNMIYVAMLVMAASIIIFNVIVSIGSTVISLVIEVVSILLYIVYTYFLFHYTKIDLTWAWSTEIIYWLLISILSYIFLKTYDWKKKIRIDPEVGNHD
jgi:Na+-driven multidrug efflux pump